MSILGGEKLHYVIFGDPAELNSMLLCVLIMGGEKLHFVICGDPAELNSMFLLVFISMPCC